MNKKELFQLFKTSFKSWLAINASIRAAALTFFIILPLPSLLLIIEAVISLFYGKTQASQILILQITSFAGPAVAGLFKELLSSASSPFSSIWGAVTIVGFSVGGAIGAFAVLRDTMDDIWGVKSTKSLDFKSLIRKRLGPFVVVSGLGLIVIVWTAIAYVLLKAITYFSINGTVTLVSAIVVQILVVFGLSLILFALTYKLIPDTKVHWRDIALASVVAGVASTATNYIIGTYVETFQVTTIVGAAGSLLIILLWIFIINEIMLFGAQLSKVYATTFSGEHTREHFSPAAERFLRSLEAAGEMIEQATKGYDVDQVEVAIKPKVKETPDETKIQAPMKEEKAERSIEAESPIVENKTGIVEPKEPDEGSVEVTVKIKSPRKKQSPRD